MIKLRIVKGWEGDLLRRSVPNVVCPCANYRGTRANGFVGVLLRITNWVTQNIELNFNLQNSKKQS